MHFKFYAYGEQEEIEHDDIEISDLKGFVNFGDLYIALEEIICEYMLNRLKVSTQYMYDEGHIFIIKTEQII